MCGDKGGRKEGQGAHPVYIILVYLLLSLITWYLELGACYSVLGTEKRRV